MSKFIISIILAIFLLIQPTLAHASTFGEGKFNSGKYNAGEESATTSNNPIVGFIQRVTGSNSSSANYSTECTQPQPSLVPEIYQINRIGSDVTLFVAPGGDPYDSFFLSYGVGDSTEQYASLFGYAKAEGALKYEVHALSLDTSYSFKVQAMNGCASGEWSNIMAVGKTDGTYTKYGTTQLVIKTKSVGSSIKRILGIAKNDQEEIDKIKAQTVQNQHTKVNSLPSQIGNSPPKRWKFIDWLLNLFK